MGPPPDANLDWESLIPEIELIAKAVGRRKNASPRVRDELAHLAVSFILEKSGMAKTLVTNNDISPCINLSICMINTKK
ncbi:MAG: hypothetical protein EBY39_08745 [Flavobacteriia bacterium]|nr:hypothetical protein [Flavobacteriia bacterium]